MALESSSPFGSSKPRTLFGDTGTNVEPFTFPNTALSTVFTSNTHTNSVLSDSHSSLKEDGKFDLKPCIVKMQDSSVIENIKKDGNETPNDKADTENKDIEKSNEASNMEYPQFALNTKENVNQSNVDLEIEQNSDNEVEGSEKANEATSEEPELMETEPNDKKTMMDIEFDMSESEDVVECANCDQEFQTLQEYMDHTCAGINNKPDDKSGRSDNTQSERKDLDDVESFNGKIVYNPDGSAYIIEGDSDSDIESIIDRKEGIIIDKKGMNDNMPLQKEIPQIDNAFFVPRNTNSMLNNTYFVPSHRSISTPIMHSYRVYDMRSRKEKSSESSGGIDDGTSKTPSSVDSSTSKVSSSALSSLTSKSAALQASVSSVPTKPILMCFICKLSFGFAKSFTTHAITEHSMELTNDEKEIMALKNSSAIIQGIGKDKEPLMSFLEPIKSSIHSLSKSLSPIKTPPSSEKVTIGKETTSVSYVYTKPKLSESFTNVMNNSPAKDQIKDLTIRDIKSQIEKKVNDANDNNASISGTLPIRGDKTEIGEASEKGNDAKRIRLETSDDSNSQSSFQITPVQRFLQDQDYSSQSPKSYLPSYSSPHRTGFYGACEEHPNGRAAGVECPSCDMVLSSSQSLGGHMTMMHSRNSCKTLKCPKCNWHYKYQETLEIHMKEKHPEGDQKCMYCLTNQSHPRLARGESYSCGYKPYRCEVCNYSTTTKGNLSIHMQSDKHLNNVQDLANSGGDLQQFNKHQQQMAAAAAAASNQQQHQPIPTLQTPPQPPPATSMKTPPHQQLVQQQQQHHSHHQHSSTPLRSDDSAKKSKPKPTWRCDVCNYETNVARNLRIHMTSEKHTHNMMVLQQNMKHMRRDMELHHMNQLVMLHQDPSFLGLTGPIPGGITFPYDGSLMMSGMPAGFGDSPVDLSKENDMNANGNDMQDVSRLFQCCVCNVFGTDSLESLHQHLQMDRTKVHENDNISVASGTYMCNLCQYKTTLKANFQLHCKTDKHIQRLQLVNHIKEGGLNNEWRLKYLNVSNPVQVRCNCCDYYTNSIHKLQIHTGNPRHEASAQLFCHLQQQECMVGKKDRAYHCSLCKFNARSKLALMQHVHSVQHLHSEGLKQLEMKEKGQLEVDIGEIFMVKEIQDLKSIKFDDETAAQVTNGIADEESSFTEQENTAPEPKKGAHTPLSPTQHLHNNNNTIKQGLDDLSQKGDVKQCLEKTHDCPYCPYTTVNEMHIKSHLATQHSNNTTTPAPPPAHAPQPVPASTTSKLGCPLCQEPFTEKSAIQKHLTNVHNVNPEGVHKLLLLVDDPKIRMPPTTTPDLMLPGSGPFRRMRDIEVDLEALDMEYTKLAAEDGIDMTEATDQDGDEQFRCQTCSKSFPNIDLLYSHQNELGHLELKQTPRGPGYLCWKKGCNQYFKTAQALQMHFREIHAKAVGLNSNDRSEYKHQCQSCSLAFKSQQKFHYHAQLHLIQSAVTCIFCPKSFQSINLLRKHVDSAHLDEAKVDQYKEELSANVVAFTSLIADPRVAKLFKVPDFPKENMKALTENGLLEGDVTKDRSPSITPVNENGVEKGAKSEFFDSGEDDLTSKEQQLLEDYMNSQPFAEQCFEDPNRKFKCHRCKVAYTRHHYLSIHNRSALHKKNEKSNYPMEKFLDPNRPYKCDICKESFTQKNILLVHNNSVSHLHKVKQHFNLPDGYNSPVPPVTSSTSSSSTAATIQSTQESSRSTLSPAISTSTSSTSGSHKKSREPSPEDDSVKPFKCNICKVSYSQGSTLDIHIRSVAHQTKASKLHELAMNGEVDLSRPLIEEPVDKALQAQQQKLLNDFLTNQTSLSQQQSLLFQGLPGLTSFPGFPGLQSISGLPLLGLPPLLPLSLSSHMFPTSTISNVSSQSQASSSKSKSSSTIESTGSKSHEKISPSPVPSSKDTVKLTEARDSSVSTASSQSVNGIQVCHRCSAVFASQESFTQHQILCSGSAASPTVSPNSAGKTRFVGRLKTAVQRNLLENFGFECVMQFNEFNQRGVKREEEVKEEQSTDPIEKVAEEKKNEEPTVNADEKEAMVKEEPKENEEEKTAVDLPEMNKMKCTVCKKQFSSVWVLKAHEEEVHKEIVPLEIVEEVGDKFKSDFEKKMPKELPIPVFEQPTTPAPKSATPVPEEKNVKQEMPPPPPPPPAQMQMDMLQMMNMFGMGMPLMPMSLMMNTQPNLMPMMMPPPGLEMQSVPVDKDSQRRQLEQAAANQKRARTRINDEQLKVLRGYFDINNSPAEEQIHAMSEQTGLPMKVIKHWFRNTLFKERQRNKDSPYNFNNPPSTTLDLEEYEKTGKLTIIEESPPMSKSPSPASMKSDSEIKRELPDSIEEHHIPIMHEHKLELEKERKPAHTPCKTFDIETPLNKSVSEDKGKEVKHLAQTAMLTPQNEMKSSVPRSVSPLLQSPIGSSPLMQSFAGLAGINLPSTPSYPPVSTTPTSTYYDSHNYSPPGSGSTGRRANRTRFTDFQVKSLQEYFEQNAYPKDDELEHLSKLLGLSPRVIVVWFQNARQKARKIYENQPAEKEGSANSPGNRASGLSYQCKKCQAVFQRYYDLIRHQKRSCFTEAEQKESNMLSDDSDSISNVTSLDNTAFSDSESENSNIGKRDFLNSSGDSKRFHCDKCDLSFSQYDTFKEHQNIHNMYNAMNLSSGSAFGMLQNMAANSVQQSLDERTIPKRKYEDEEDDHDQPKDKRLRTTILPEQLDYLYQKYQIDCNPSRKQLEAISKEVGLKKRVVQVWFQNTRARERKGQYRAHQQLIHKRCPICRALFRAKSALESHLATKHPDEMAKGDINIDAIPDAAIESPGPSSSSSLPPPSPDYNKLLAPPNMSGLLPYMPPASLGGLQLPPMADPIQLSMKQFYEDSYKKYINELSATSHTPQKVNIHEFTSTPIKAEAHHAPPPPPPLTADDDAPLDLSKPLKVTTHTDTDKHKEGPMSQSSFSSGEISSGGGHSGSERTRQNSGRNSVHSILGSAVDQTYMMNRFNHDNALHHGGDHDESLSNLSNSPASPAHSQSQQSQGSASGNKRYRTQMTSLQVRIMKHIFQDYKTPTMAECEMLGRVIGLQKRVVQVWFQNARAKEKKAKLNMKSYGSSELDFPKPPEECSFCNFKYSHKYTIQDHIFTHKHIEKIKDYIQSQTDAEREMSTSAASMAGVTAGLMHTKQSNELDQMRKIMEEASSQSQMAQLQSMGLGPFGLPPSAMSGMGLLPPDLVQGMKKESSSLSKEKTTKGSNKSDSSSRKESVDVLAGSFGGLLPGMDPSMLPLMYPGLPGFLSGMPPVPPGLVPGTEHLLGYDPMTYGTPLPLLQIPQQAIKDVSSKLMEPRATIGQYTQDCKSISSLRSLVSTADYNCVQEATVDVGYICKKCQIVYPAKEACVAHQRLMCLPGGKLPEGINVMLKLEQIQYECKLCSDKVSTVQEFKTHCDTESHKTKLAVYQQQRHTSGAITPKPTTPSPSEQHGNKQHS